MTISRRGRPYIGIMILLVAGMVAHPRSSSAQEVKLEAPSVVLTDIPFDVTVTVKTSGDEAEIPRIALRFGESEVRAFVEDGTASFESIILSDAGSHLSVWAEGTELASQSPVVLPGWVSIMPALFAILIALVFRQVIPAIFSGVWLGAWLSYGFSWAGFWHGLLDSVQVYVLSALSDTGHLSVLIFSLMIGGLIGIVSANGGTVGIVERIVGFANSPRRGQVTAGFLGLAIFFDDYANTLVVGNTMRPVTDRLRISREKLAYIVDSTAAPVAALALVTTWIGYEVGLIDAAVRSIEGYDEAAYSVFLSSVFYSFYPILAIVFVFGVALMRRDFGPMYRAERRAMEEGLLLRPGAEVGMSEAEAEAMKAKEGKPRRAINAVIPVGVLVFGTLIGIYVTGVSASEPGASFRDVIGNGDSYKSLVWASLLGVMVAALLSVVQRILTLGEVVEAWYTGLKALMFAAIILVLAWSLSAVNETLHTGAYLASVLGEHLSPHLLPAAVFVLSAITAFATGTSWGVMGIVMPLTVPLAWAIMEINGLTEDPTNMHIFYSSVSAVLAGAVWGDHCSPISDTTILSSMASGCDHVDHVRTQLPYALSVGVVGLLVGTIPVGFGLYDWWVGLVVGGVVLLAMLRFLGKTVPDYVPEESRSDQAPVPGGANSCARLPVAGSASPVQPRALAHFPMPGCS
jgi:Na+/H+ antiporter NhaC